MEKKIGTAKRDIIEGELITIFLDLEGNPRESEAIDFTTQPPRN